MKKTHRALADELGVPINAVAIAREVARGTSADGRAALNDAGGDLVEAARGLAKRRMTERMADGETLEAITSELMEVIVREAKMDARDNGVRRVPLTRIVRSRWQPRGLIFDEGPLWELARSIQEQGLINPIVVFEVESPEDGQAVFELVAGERRTRAVLGLAWAKVDKEISAKGAVEKLALSGLGALPGEARDLLAAARAEILARVEVAESEEDLGRLHRIAVVENIERQGLTALEEARALKGLLDAQGWSQRELARAIGKSQGYVAQRLGLLDLAPAVQEAVSTRVITATHARAIGQVPAALQPAVTEYVTKAVQRDDSPVSTRQVQDVTRQLAKFMDPGRWRGAVENWTLTPAVRNRLLLMQWAVRAVDLGKRGEKLLELRDVGYSGNVLARAPLHVVRSYWREALKALGLKDPGKAWERFARETGRTCEACVFGERERVAPCDMPAHCARWYEEELEACEHFIGPEDPVVIPVRWDLARRLKEAGVEVVEEPFEHVTRVSDYVVGYQQAVILQQKQQEQVEEARSRVYLEKIQAYLEWQLEQPDKDLAHFQARTCTKCVNYRSELLVEGEMPPCRLAVEPLKARYGNEPRAPEFGVLVAEDGRLLPCCEGFAYKEIPALAAVEGVQFGTARERALGWLREIGSGRGYGTRTWNVLFGVLAWLDYGGRTIGESS